MAGVLDFAALPRRCAFVRLGEESAGAQGGALTAGNRIALHAKGRQYGFPQKNLSPRFVSACFG